MKKEDYKIGFKNKEFTIIKELYRKYTNDRKLFVDVECSCKNIRTLSLTRFKSENSFIKCNECNLKDNKFNYKKGLYIGDISKTYFSLIKKRAKKRNIEFNITQQYIWDLLVNQNFTCILSGLPIKLEQKLKNKNLNYENITASLDRIDSSLGYIEGNVQWVHKTINYMKNILKNKEFIQICFEVTNYQKDNFEPSSTNLININRKRSREGAETNS